MADKKPKDGKKGNNKMLMIGGGVVVLILIGVAVYFMMSGDKEEEVVETTTTTETSAPTPPPPTDTDDSSTVSSTSADCGELTIDSDISCFPINTEPKGKCGPSNNFQRCMGKEYCASNERCGEYEEYKHPPYQAFSGPDSSFHSASIDTGKCGPSFDGMKCFDQDFCQDDGKCGANRYDPYSFYGGPKTPFAPPDTIPTEMAERNGKCGPGNQGKRCPGDQYCSSSGTCGSYDEYKHDKYSAWSGPESGYWTAVIDTGKCGAGHDGMKCLGDQVCNRDGDCGPWNTHAFDANAQYAGPDSNYTKSNPPAPTGVNPVTGDPLRRRLRLRRRRLRRRR